MGELADSILQKAGPEWLLIFALIAILAWVIRYLFRYLMEDVKLKAQMIPVLKEVAKVLKSLR